MDTKPALEASLVQQFIGNAHGDLDRVKELLAQEPALINACWDWGAGDFETGLGAGGPHGKEGYRRISASEQCASRSFRRGHARQTGYRQSHAGSFP